MGQIQSFLFIFLCVLGYVELAKGGSGLACNWGLQSTHPLPPDIVVRVLKEYGFNKVKLFEADPGALKALGRSGIQVMVGIPNYMLASLASAVGNAEAWGQRNVSNYISNHGTDIRSVAIGNEPFLRDYKDLFVNTIFPARQNIQAALIKAGLGKQVKATIPINADVYQTDSGLPSGGYFRPELQNLMMKIIKFLQDNGGFLTINIYPFLSMKADPSFPKEYAFFNNTAKPLVDGSIVYTNVYDANFDTLISALEKNGFGHMPVVIGEVGWPTDGDPSANIKNAKRFNQALLDRIVQGQGSPRRRTPSDVYIFSLIDEDHKSTLPGNFERHWGILRYDGGIKYPFGYGKWTSRRAGQRRQVFGQAMVCDVAFGRRGPQHVGSKHHLRLRERRLHQPRTMNQSKGACNFNNSAVITTVDPSKPPCRFEIMIDIRKQKKVASPTVYRSSAAKIQGIFAALILGIVGLVVCDVH
ncbi:Haloacid dehalogenase-like hydrolase superfamily protein [Hibiscus syriacus]|uniref:glucan endo-1,3-beta-D-glucosidase n=1 Tax=Hibiscus syriacus TaxID=106335 RepID=A0A6A2Y176_HIBSY|nr:Haloacid dehalogenase-like hydrolase superfamily protein [Hibiscus syriacus]